MSAFDNHNELQAHATIGVCIIRGQICLVTLEKGLQGDSRQIAARECSSSVTESLGQRCS